MGKSSLPTQGDLSKNYRFVTLDQSVEENNYYIDEIGDEDCYYFCQDFKLENDYETYLVIFPYKIVNFLKEFIQYKFGTIDFRSGEWYYFVWSEHRPVVTCDVFNYFYESVEEDSRRFWRTAKLLINNLSGSNNGT